MTRSLLRRRAVWAGALAWGCAGVAGCDSVLDIDDPKLRPDAAAGEPGEAGMPSDSKSGSGGKAGNGGIPSALGGAGAGGALTMDPAGSGGEAGEANPRECEPKAARCRESSPEICDDAGQWIANTEQAAGPCAIQCDAGKCVECASGEKRCAICDEADENCRPSQPQTCVDGAWTNDGSECAHFCASGTCVTPASCQDQFKQQTTCAGGTESCCRSIPVPGGTFLRNYDGGEDHGDDSASAELSPFFLDKFEVTIGRLRSFVNAFEEINLVDGDGKSAHIDEDKGWNGYSLPASGADLVAQLKNCDLRPGSTWSDLAADNNALPVNCVTFAVAYAFCIWDGGRLPSDAELNFAASGGAEQRVYPWKSPALGDLITADYANYDNANPGPIEAGMKKLGNGRWGQADLAGNVFEWTLDYWGDLPETCNDCINTTESERVVRGGAYASEFDILFASFRTSQPSGDSRPFIGFRCAREPN